MRPFLTSCTWSYDGLDMPACKMGLLWCSGAILTGCPSLCHQWLRLTCMTAGLEPRFAGWKCITLTTDNYWAWFAFCSGSQEVALWAIWAARIWEHWMSVANVLLLYDAWWSVPWRPSSGDFRCSCLQLALHWTVRMAFFQF